MRFDRPTTPGKNKSSEEDGQFSLSSNKEQQTGNSTGKFKRSMHPQFDEFGEGELRHSLKNASADQTRFEELLKLNHDSISLYLMSIVRHAVDAEDIFQRCSVVMWRKFESYQTDKSFLAWACGIARLEVLNFRRTQRSRPSVFANDVMELLASSVQSMEIHEEEPRLTALKECLSKLTETERDLLKRIYWEEDGFGTVASELGCTIRTFYNRIYLIRKRLLTCIEKRLRSDIDE